MERTQNTSFELRQQGQREAAQAADTLAAANIADDVERAFLKGDSAKPVPTTKYSQGRHRDAVESLGAMVSDRLCDLPGNVLHDVIGYIGRRAQAGDEQALKIVQRIAAEHAEFVVGALQ